MRVGVLTGGGDCPGLNAVIRAVVRKGEVEHGDTFVGFPRRLEGRDGAANVNHPLDVETMPRDPPAGRDADRGTSRTNPYKMDGGADRR